MSKIVIACLILTGCNSKQNKHEAVLDKPSAEKYDQTIQTHRDKQNTFFKSADSPLPDSVKQYFKGLSFYPVDTNYRVMADFEAIDNGPVFQIAASGDIADHYQTVGKLHFKVMGIDEMLEVYENQNLKASGYELYFIPFYDLTNGKETYGGGRYLDMPRITGDQIIIDFNYAYQPYCAFNHYYSCPIPPPVNSLNVEVRAGERE